MVSSWAEFDGLLTIAIAPAAELLFVHRIAEILVPGSSGESSSARGLFRVLVPDLGAPIKCVYKYPQWSRSSFDQNDSRS